MLAPVKNFVGNHFNLTVTTILDNLLLGLSLFKLLIWFSITISFVLRLTLDRSRLHKKSFVIFKRFPFSSSARLSRLTFLLLILNLIIFLFISLFQFCFFCANFSTIHPVLRILISFSHVCSRDFSFFFVFPVSVLSLLISHRIYR